MSRFTLLGRYTASDLQRAMRVALARADLRRLRRENAARGAMLSAPFDVRPNGQMVRL